MAKNEWGGGVLLSHSNGILDIPFIHNGVPPLTSLSQITPLVPKYGGLHNKHKYFLLFYLRTGGEKGMEVLRVYR